MKKIMLAAIVLVLVAAQLAMCEEYKVSIEGELTYTNRYIWRGFDMVPNDGDAFQAGITFTPGDSGHSLNIWGSSAADNSNDFDEIDLSWDYTKPMPGLSGFDLSYGLIYYGFAPIKDDSVEAYVGVSMPKMVLEPTVMVFADFGSGNGWYTTLGVNQSLGKPFLGIPLNLAASVGYQDGYWGVDSGISDVNFSLSTVYKVGTVNLIPALNYTIIPEETVNPVDESEFWFSLTGVTEIKHTN